MEVSDGGDGNLTADIHYQDEAVFTNRSTKGMLEVKKVVEGNMGNRTSGFTFTAQLMDSGSAPFTEPVAYTKDGESGTITPSSDGKVAFDLRGGDEIIFTLPFGTKYAITEAEANKDGYKTTIENAEGTVTEETPEVVFTNSRGVTVPTMAEEKTPVWILLLPAAGIALVVISFMRRKKQ